MEQQTVITYMVGSLLQGIKRVPVGQSCLVLREVEVPRDAPLMALEAVVFTNAFIDRYGITKAQETAADYNTRLESIGAPKLKTIVYGGVL